MSGRGVMALIVGAIALQRVWEVRHAARTTRALLARGAVEAGARLYPVVIAMHVAWFAAVLLDLPEDGAIGWGWVALLALLQLGRLWVVVTLGPYWTTRIVTLPGEPLVARGPYRFLRHPNYLIVVGEIAALPLAFGEARVAAVFSLLNAAVLAVRIRQEDAALQPRRALPPQR